MRLPLSLSVVHCFDLLGRARYFFIPCKGTSNTKRITATKQQHQSIIYFLNTQHNNKITERKNRQAILISKTLLDRIILVTEMRCKINRQTFRGLIPGFYSTSGYTAISVRTKSVSTRSPYVRFGGVVEICSRF